MPAPRIRTRLSPFTANQLLAYDRKTGILTWRVDRGPNVRAGDKAGSVRKDGMRSLSVNGQIWLAHRLIWFMVKGEMPEGRLTFRDNDSRNLAWSNIVLESELASGTYSATYQRERRAREREELDAMRRREDPEQ